MIRQVMWGLLGFLLERISVPTHHQFSHAILNNVWNDFAGNIFVVLRLRHLSLLSQRLALQDVIIVSIDRMTLLRAGARAARSILTVISISSSGVVRVLSRTLPTLYVLRTRPLCHYTTRLRLQGPQMRGQCVTAYSNR